MEIERKWLAGTLPEDVGRAAGTPIEQGYLTAGADGPEVRIRRRDGDCSLTVKGAGELARTEVELPLSLEQFESLWPLTEGRRVLKTRILAPLGAGLTAEVDVYEDRALVVAEVEFESVEQAREFAAPPWLGREVTDDPTYKNRNLAR
jgi:CYTH domain-containing protein